MSDIAGFAAALPTAERHLRIDGGFAPESMLAITARDDPVRSRTDPVR